MALTTVTVHGEILDLDGLTPAVGTVTFKTLIELNDVVDNVTYQPSTFVATLDVNGEFTIVLPATDNPDLTPVNWVYQAFVSTGTWRETIYFQLPFAPGVTEFADLVRLDYDPCAGTLGGEPVPPPAEGIYVLKTGDTMSGNLIINANLQVAGDVGVADDLTVGDDLSVLGDAGVTGLLTANTISVASISGASATFTTGSFTGSLTTTFQGNTLNVGQLLAMAQSTSVLSGGEFNPNADPTKIDITAMTGFIVDWNSSVALTPTNPQLTYVTYAGVTALTPAFAPFTYYLVNSAGVLVQQATNPTPTQRRQSIFLGLTLTQGGVIIVDQTLPVIPSQVNNQLVDLMNSLAPFSSTAGNVLSANGANLAVNKSAGSIFARAFSQVPTYLDPHNGVLPAQTPMQFRHITALTGSAGPITTLLNVGQYDPNGAGVLTPVGGGANTSTNFRVWGFANNTITEQILVQYGQNTYASLAAAVQGIGSGNYIQQPATFQGALLGWISVVRTAVDLSNPAQAVFTKASRFAIP